MDFFFERNQTLSRQGGKLPTVMSLSKKRELKIEGISLVISILLKLSLIF